MNAEEKVKVIDNYYRIRFFSRKQLTKRERSGTGAYCCEGRN